VEALNGSRRLLPVSSTTPCFSLHNSQLQTCLTSYNVLSTHGRYGYSVIDRDDKRVTRPKESA